MVRAGSIVIIIYTSFMLLLGSFHVFMGPNYARVEAAAAACADLPRGRFQITSLLLLPPEFVSVLPN